MVNALKNLLKRQPEPVWLSNCPRRGYDLLLPVLEELGAQGYGLLGWDISRGGLDAEGERSRLGNEPHVWVVEGEPGRMHSEGDPALLSRWKGETSKTEQHALRTSDRGDQVAVVELDHLVTCLLSGVVHLYGHLDRLSGILRLHGKITVGKRGVAQPMSKGEQRTRRRVDVITVEHRAITSSTMPNVGWHLADRTRQAHGQATARIHFASQHVGQAIATLLSRWKHLHQRVTSRGDRSKRVDASTEYHYHKRRSRLGNGIDQFLLHAAAVEPGPVVPLSDPHPSRYAAASGDHDYGYVGIPRHLHRFSEASLVIAQHLTAFGIAYVDVIA